MQTTRREFLKATTVGAVLAGVPAGWAGGVYAADGLMLLAGVILFRKLSRG